MSAIEINRPLVINNTVTMNGNAVLTDISATTIHVNTVTPATGTQVTVDASTIQIGDVSGNVNLSGTRIVIDVSGNYVQFGDVLKIMLYKQ